MQASLSSAILSDYYQRTYGSQLPVRVGSMLAVAVVTAGIQVWSPFAAVLWAAVFVTCEAVIARWWSGVKARLPSGDEAEVFRLYHQLVAMSAGLTNLGVLPCLLTALHGGQNAAFGLMLSAGALLILSTQHSLNKKMFLFTAPGPAVALVWNMYALGHGPESWLFAGMAVLFVGNAYSLHVGNASSFSEQVRLQLDADVANKTKRLFLANMSHEIRTPLNGVLGMAQVMELNELSPAQRERLEVVRSSGETLLALLNDILDYSKIEAGRVELESIPFNLEDCLESACLGHAALAAEKGLGFDIVVRGQRGLHEGDPVRIRQIAQNLVANAVKFTAAGEIRVEALAENERLVLSVRDTGVGISEESRSRLFQEFVQADGSTTRRFGGTGLGLAICRDLARLMGGDIRVESELGKGSCFTVEVPLPYAGADERPADVATASDLNGEERRLRVLVAEDNLSNQLVLKSILAHTCAEPEIVANGALAVEAFEQGGWDLVLMDVQMPVMDGLAATREIRRREAEAGRPPTPIYALSADAMKHQVAAHRAAGMDGHLSKPIQIAEIFALVAEIAAAPAPEADRRVA